MNSTINWISIIRRISSILLLIFLVMQIIIVLLLAADVDDFEIDEIHEVCGFIFLGLMVVHILVYWKSLKSLLKFKN
jgi:succinate dehydrogenase/fumarate reductase cytochrome b subunit